MDGSRVAQIEDAAALERLWEATLRFVVGRGRSRREVEQRLRDRRADERQADAVMERLAAAGLDDEEANADLRVERLAVRGWASRRIRSDMLRVGFSHETVHRAVAGGLEPGHDQQILDAEVTRTGVPSSAADRRRMADRLVRRGLPPAAVRNALRPDEGAGDETAAAPDAAVLVRQVQRRYPGQATDPAERRRALGWLARRGVGPDDARRILTGAVEG